MKSPFLCALIVAAIPFHASGGTLFYVPIPATGSDAQSGIDSAKTYTSAIAAGNAKTGGRAVNGVPLAALTGSGNSITANGVTVSAATGTLINGGGKSDSIRADGALASLLSGMIFNDGAADNSEEYVVLDPATLVAGKTYDLRVYVCNVSGENRPVNLSFAGDGKAAVNTDFFNEDDATTSAGGFAEPDQVYYINYRFTWDGASTPGFTATQKLGSTPFCLFALTNQEVGGDRDIQPAGAMVAAQAESLDDSSNRRGSTSVAETVEEIGVASDVFYNSGSLRNHGRWVTVRPYGRCWQPTGMDADWQPYTRGHWVHSGDGWVWDSDEEFGWATYHYGRWFREEDTGWYWVPGKVWAPSWVSWRHGHSYVGWAALPPAAVAAAGVGISSWADHRWGIGPRAYNFVNVRDFGAPSMARVLIPRQENPGIMANTVNVTNIANTKRGIYSGGPSYSAVNNALGRAGSEPIPMVRIERNSANRPVTPDGKFSQLTAGVLALAAPMVTRTKKTGAMPPVAATIAAPNFDKGWNGLPDPKHAAALQAKIANETPSATAKSAPARLPGALLFPTGRPGTNTESPLKPFRPGNSGDSTLIRPGQPPQQTGRVIAKPGQPMPAKPDQPPTTTAGRPFPKPGTPALSAPATADQPATPPPDGMKNRGKSAAAENIPVPQPAPPRNSSIPTPTRPEQPTNAPAVKPGQRVPTADTIPKNPGPPSTPNIDDMKKHGKSAGNPPIPTTTPSDKPTIPTNPVPAPETPHSKKRPGPPATSDPIPRSNPNPTSGPTPEFKRPNRRSPESVTPPTPPTRAATPLPDIPRPAPIARPNPRPTAPATAPIERPMPRPPQPVASPPRTAPPMPPQFKPGQPPPGAPSRGGKPTPTPAPGQNR